MKNNAEKIEVDVLVPSGYDYIEARVFSERNAVISKDSDVKPNDPNKDKKLFGRAYDGMYSTDVLFPVLDIELHEDMDGILLFENAIGGICRVNPMYYPDDEQPIMGKTVIPGAKLEWWENWVYFNEPNCRCTGFYVRKQFKDYGKKVSETFKVLSNGWKGRVEMVGVTGTDETVLNVQNYALESISKMEANKTDDLSTDNLIRALNNSIQYLLDSQELNEKSPMYGSLNLFYDYEAQTYRHKTWLWTHAPAIQTFVRAMEIESSVKKFSRERLLKAATDLGDLSLKYQELDKTKPYFGYMLCRYDFSVFNLKGYESKYSPVDSLMYAGIGMMPLYHATKDERYLNFCTTMVGATGDLLNLDPLVQQDYYPVTGGWKTNTVNEAGFGMEGIADVYLETGDESYYDIGKKYIENLVDHLENDEGLWDKNYFRHSKMVDPNDFLTRGMAWAFMGISSAYRMNLGDAYLEKSRVMAESLIKNQREDGSWSFYYNQNTDLNGVSEKGTAAWSYLFYRMYSMTNEQVYLDTARKALTWLINNQYFGDDLQGGAGIPAETPQSGVVFRPFFKLSCSYTVSFFALALLEELALANKPE